MPAISLARAQVLDGEVRHAPGGVPREAAGLVDDRGRPARERVGDEGAAVAGAARVGEEHAAVLHGARVRREVGERHAQRGQALGERRGGSAHGLGHDHPSLPGAATRASVAAGRAGACTLSVCGASGGTANMRSAAPITEANTGALTSPP